MSQFLRFEGTVLLMGTGSWSGCFQISVDRTARKETIETMDSETLLGVGDYAQSARTGLPKDVLDYFEGGAKERKKDEG